MQEIQQIQSKITSVKMSSELYFPAPLCLCVVPLSSSLGSSVSQLNSLYLHLVNYLHTFIYKSPGSPTVGCQTVGLTLVVQSVAKPAASVVSSV